MMSISAAKRKERPTMTELTHETVKRLRERIEMRSDGLMLCTHTLFAYIDQLEEQVAALKSENEQHTPTPQVQGSH